MSTIRRELVYQAAQNANALVDYNIHKDFHDQIEFMIQTILADSSLTEDEKTAAIRLINKEYDRDKIIHNSGTKKICENCNKECLATLYCEYCVQDYLKARFSNWTSGNNDIDNLIQKYQSETLGPDYIVEWIPYNNLKNIEYLTKGGFSKIYTAGWINGPYEEWDSKKQQLERTKVPGIQNFVASVILKELENIEGASQSWFEEAKNKISEINASYKNTTNELDANSNFETNNLETNYTSSRLFTSKIHQFENFPEPRNATEEEQEAFHSKSYKFSIPHNINEFNNSINRNYDNTPKSSSISKVLSKVFMKLKINSKNDNFKEKTTQQQIKRQDHIDHVNDMQIEEFVSEQLVSQIEQNNLTIIDNKNEVKGKSKRIYSEDKKEDLTDNDKSNKAKFQYIQRNYISNDDENDISNNPNLHSEDQDEFEIPEDGFE
ncbi:kinase-like domain-containing protein [Rhizophagus irregularis DAOM 181602=DAOM 197198]|nr:kinase-like domain-containing protein [Rhizophagus irregularis DAOM 181602=DAOM 197198]